MRTYISLITRAALSCTLLTFTACTVYKSEGKKSFESASNDYSSRANSLKFKDCQIITAEVAEQLLADQQLSSGPHDDISYSDDDQNYYSCPPSIDQ